MSIKIIIVDDERLARRVKRLLSSCEEIVDEAKNAQEASEKKLT